MANREQIMTDKDREMYNIIMLYIAQNVVAPSNMRSIAGPIGTEEPSKLTVSG